MGKAGAALPHLLSYGGTIAAGEVGEQAQAETWHAPPTFLKPLQPIQCYTQPRTQSPPLV